MTKISFPKADSEHLIVYPKQMSEIEDQLFNNGMPEAALMEKVGIKISNWFLERENLLKSGLVVIIGPGHNGGDGAVIARELFLKGYIVSVWCPFQIRKTLTIKHLNYITSLGIKILINPPDPEKNELWIDAVFGNNQTRSTDSNLIKLFNEKSKTNTGKIVSIDIPTGLNPNSGKPFADKAVKANYTLSIGLKKIGLLQDSAIPYVGQIHNIEIGIFKSHFVKLDQRILSLSRKDFNDISLYLPPANSDKYSRGRTLLIVGSEKYPGAALLAIKGALASGVGSITALSPKSVANLIWNISPEVVMNDFAKSSEEGNSLFYDSLKNQDLNRYETILIGPGIGVDITDWEKAAKYLCDFKGTLILDADALNRIAKSKNGSKFFLDRSFQTWITPHYQEFKRLFPDLDEHNRVDLSMKAANQFKLDLLLKGANSIISDSKGSVWQIYESDPFTARAGLGDLLSGFISGLCALELSSGEIINAESFAKYVFLHSYAASNSSKGSTASLIGNQLSKIVRQIKTRQML